VRAEFSGDRRPGKGSRGQLVLVVAVVVAIALVPVVLAYLQLGYHPDVRAGADHADPERDAERALSRAVHESALAANGSWSRRATTVEAFRSRLAPRLETIRRSGIERGTAHAISYNGSAAKEWATRSCPSGPDRQFGPCEARDGVVVQERAGETHVLAAAFDLAVTTDRGRTEWTVVVRAVGGVDRGRTG